MYTPTLHLRTALVLIAAAALALVSARSASAGGTCHQPPTESSTPTVQLEALCFSPTVTRVDVGSDVEFVNLDAFAHNVVGHGVSWGQFADIGPGESLVVAFDTPGIHPFSCTLHPGMVGAIVVGDVTQSAATSDATGWSDLGTAAIVAAMVIGATALWYIPHRPGLDQPS